MLVVVPPDSRNKIMKLNAMKLNLGNPDEIYQALIDLHDGLTEEQSRAVNAKLILLLANHIGDEEVIRQAIEIARQSGDKTPSAD